MAKSCVCVCVCVCECLILLAFFLVTHASATTPTNPASEKISDAAKSRIQAMFLKAPLHFEANQGQADEQVKFVARGAGYQMYLTATEAVIKLRKPEDKPSTISGESIRDRLTQNSKPETRNFSESVVRMKLVGANPDAEVSGLEQLPGKVNYFIGNDPNKWRTNIPTYTKVEYRNVYPGTNLVYYGNQGQLEYDFVVSPGADPRAIKIAFEGADEIKTDGRGDLIIRTVVGDLRMHIPLVYQEGAGVKKEIAAAFVVNTESEIENSRPLSVGFRVAAHDATKPLIIDPVLSYATFLGGMGNDWGFGIAVDAFGSAHVTGATGSSNFPIASALQSLNKGGSSPFPIKFPLEEWGASEAFITKLSPDGSGLIYSTYLGGTDGDVSFGISVDSFGNAYVAGQTCSSDFPITIGALQTSKAGDCDAFVTKLNAQGDGLYYSTYLGGSFADSAEGGIAVDGSGRAYVAGWTDSTDFPTVNPLQATSHGGRDVFVSVLNSSGSGLVYSTYLGGSSSDVAFGIAVDAAGSAYITGSTGSSDFPVTNAFQPSSGGGADAFMTKISWDGLAATLAYSTYLGGGGADKGLGIAVDSSGNAYITGGTQSSDFPIKNTLVPPSGFFDAFVTKLSNDGSTIIYSTYLGRLANDPSGFGIAVDRFSNAYVTGINFVRKLNPAGSAEVYAFPPLSQNTPEIVPSYGQLWGLAIAVDASGNAYVAGSTAHPPEGFFPLNALQPTPGGGADAIVLKINAADGATLSSGQSVTVFSTPGVPGEAGVSATLTNNTTGSEDMTIAVENLRTNPETVGIFDVGGGYVDLRVTGADQTDTVMANFYYPSTITGATEGSLSLFYFTGLTWVPVRSSGNTDPVKNTADNLDNTISGGRFTVTFDNTSTPQITQLTGTVFAMTTRTLVSIGPAKIWVGLKNSDDVGIKFDLLAEVYKGGILVGSGQVNSVAGGSSGFNNAKLDNISLNLFAPVDFPPGSILRIKLSVRNACTASGKNSGTARLWYNDAAANSQFAATIGGVARNYFLRNGFALTNSAGSGPKSTIDVAAGAKCSAFKTFGTWSIAP